MPKPDEKEYREIAAWLREVVGDHRYQRFLFAIDEKIKDLERAALRTKDDNAWGRGYACGMKDMRNEPFDTIERYGTDQDTSET